MQVGYSLVKRWPLARIVKGKDNLVRVATNVTVLNISFVLESHSYLALLYLGWLGLTIITWPITKLALQNFELKLFDWTLSPVAVCLCLLMIHSLLTHCTIVAGSALFLCLFVWVNFNLLIVSTRPDISILMESQTPNHLCKSGIQVTQAQLVIIACCNSYTIIISWAMKLWNQPHFLCACAVWSK